MTFEELKPMPEDGVAWRAYCWQMMLCHVGTYDHRKVKHDTIGRKVRDGIAVPLRENDPRYAFGSKVFQMSASADSRPPATN